EIPPAALAGNAAYQQALMQLSAAHSPSVDGGMYGPCTHAGTSGGPETHVVDDSLRSPDLSAVSISHWDSTSRLSRDPISAPASLASPSFSVPSPVDEKD